MKFEKGNKVGNRFTKDKQPEPGKVGRKPQLPELPILLAKVLGGEQEITIGKQKVNITGAEALIIALHGEALNGNVRAAELLLNRGYGMQKQTVDLAATVQTTSLSPEQFQALLNNVSKSED